MAQTFQGRFVAPGETIDFTPTADVVAGQVVVDGLRIGVARDAIAANATGALTVRGEFAIVKVNGVIGRGVVVYWDVVGNPEGGAAGSGAATVVAAGNTRLGITTLAAAATDEFVNVLLAE